MHTCKYKTVYLHQERWTMVDILNQKCTKCGALLRRALLLAIAIEFGAKTRDPNLCTDDGEHDWQPIDNAAGQHLTRTKKSCKMNV